MHFKKRAAGYTLYNAPKIGAPNHTHTVLSALRQGGDLFFLFPRWGVSSIKCHDLADGHALRQPRRRDLKEDPHEGFSVADSFVAYGFGFRMGEDGSGLGIPSERV